MVGSGSNHWEFCEGGAFSKHYSKRGWFWTETQWVSHPSCSFLLLVDLLTVTRASPPAYEHSLFPCSPGHSLSLCGSSAQALKSSSISSSFLKCVFAPRLTLVSSPVPQTSTLCASLHLCEALPAHSPAT